MANRVLFGAGKWRYETPLMEVIRLEHRSTLLDASAKGTMQDYSVLDYYEE